MIDKNILESISTSAASGRVVAVLAAGVFAVAVAQAAEPAPGMRVTKDPVTGELRAPSAQESAAMEATTVSAKPGRIVSRGLVTGKANPQPVLHATGMVSLELDESSLSYSVAKRGADGKINWVCVTGKDAAVAAMDEKSKLVTEEHNHEEK